MKRPIIIGAGMAGLLAANMLARHRPIVIELAKQLPNNHHALLRFRSSIVGDVLGIPFRAVNVIKCSVPMATEAAAALSYAYKATGTFRSDRSLPAQTEVGERFIAPPGFISQMFEMARRSGVEFQWGVKASADQIDDLQTEYGGPVISTVPMPVLMDILGWKAKPEFRSTKGMVYKVRVPHCDAFATVYDPRPETPFTRASITGDQLIVERPYTDWCAAPWTKCAIISEACRLLGLSDISLGIEEDEIEGKLQPYAKVLPIDEAARKAFVYWATDRASIYSLGRFATWRPGLLLDDLVQDIRLIERWCSSESRYEVARHR